MAGKAISGGRARRNIRIAQTAGVALGVSAAALWAMKVPVVEDPLPTKPEVQQPAAPDTKPSGASADSQPMDRESVVGTAERMEVAGRIQRPTESLASGEKPAVAAPPSDLKYVGSIREPSRMLALVSRGDGKKQKLMAVGREWDGVKLLAVNEDEIQVEDATGVKTISRAERRGPAVEWTKMASNTPVASTTTQAGMLGAAGARAVDATQAAKMRQALEERSSRRRGQAVTLTPQMLRELGLTEKDAAAMSQDQLQELSDKYQRVVNERGGTDQAQPDGNAPPGANN